MVGQTLRLLGVSVMLGVVGCRKKPATVPVAGTVRTTAGASLAEARVCAWPLASDSTTAGWQPRCTTTDADGRYTLRLPESTVHLVADARDMQPGHHRAHPVPLRAWLTINAKEPPSNADITLSPGGRWHRGRVVDVWNEPIPNASVVLTGVDHQRIGLQVLGTTDDDGAYAIWGAHKASVAIAADGHILHDSIRRKTARGVEHVAIVESRIVGRAILPSGKPASSARVTVTAPASAFGSQRFSTMADSRGRFELRGLPPGRHRILARTPDAAGLSEPVTLGLGETSEVLTVRLPLVLSPLHLVVADTDTGTVAPHCMVRIAAPSSEHMSIPWFHADGDGRVDTALPRGPYEVRGLNCVGWRGRPPYPEFVVGPGTPSTVRLEVERGVTYRGRLVTAEGLPVAGQRISLTRDGHPHDDGLDDFISDHPMWTDSDGRFEASGLITGRYRLWAGLDPTHASILLDIDTSTTVHTVALPPSGTLELATPGARDGSFVNVTLCDPSPDGTRRRSALARTRSQRVVFEDIAPGRYEIGDHASQQGCSDDRDAQIEVFAGRTASASSWLPDAPVRTISGIVLGPDGLARAGVIVELSAWPRSTELPIDWTGLTGQRTVTDDRGRFSFDAVPAGERQLTAVLRGLRATVQADTREHDADVDIVLGP